MRPILDIKLSDEDRAFLEERARQRSAPHLEVIRAKALLMASEGHANVDIAQAVGIGARTITIWRREFRERGLEGLKERRRSGRPRAFPPEVRAAVTHLACQKPGAPIPIEGILGVTRSVAAVQFEDGADIQAELATEVITVTLPEQTTTGDVEASPDPTASKPSLPAHSQIRFLMVWLPCLLSQDPDRGLCLHLPFSRLSAPVIAWVLRVVGLVDSISARTVQRWLSAEKIKPWNFRSWITPKDLKSFLERAKVVLALYARVPSFKKGEVAYSLDEKTSIQARARCTQDPPKKGKPGRVQSTYARKGAVQLFAALNVAVGSVFARLHTQKTFAVFSEFVTSLILMAVSQGNSTIHLIIDNGSTHRPKALQAWIDAWLVQQELKDVTVHVHRLPVRSSWLNQVEIFFGQLQSFVLTPNNYPSIDALKERITQFIDFWNLYPQPIDWTYTVADLQHQFERTPDTPDPRIGRPTKKRRAKKRPVFGLAA